jgi:hypothetical protein
MLDGVSKTDYKRRLRESPPEIFHTQHLQKTRLSARNFLTGRLSIGAAGGDMKNKTFFAGVLTIILGLGCVVITRHIYATTNAPQHTQSTPTKVIEDDIPDHIFYGEIFSVIAKLKNVRDFQDRAQLTDEETDFLRVTAEQCAEGVAKQDAIAEKRIAALRQQSLKSKPTTSTPPIPAEVAELQAQRDAVILHCRDVLRKELGNEKFDQFRLAAKSIVQIRVSRVR